jgi:Rab-GTPase-TBC domain
MFLDTTSRRVSLANTEEMDDVQLGHGRFTLSIEHRNSGRHMLTLAVSSARASVTSMSSSKALPVHMSKTVSHDSLPFSSTSSVTSDKTPTPTTSISISAANMARQLKSPFSFFARNPSSNDKRVPGVVSPTDRRKSDQESVNEDRQSQASLRDRFKVLRLREEAGIVVGDDLLHGGPNMSLMTEKVDSPVIDGGRDSIVSSPTLDTHLAPGTAAGLAEGPRDSSSQPVDWDLWQTVVSEGPAAVARTSPEELTRAIAAGIPQAIRGVIWQVLANSKEEALEQLYRSLVIRGTEQDRPTNGHAVTDGASVKDKDSVASSASSVHSEHSPTTPGDSGDGFTNPQAPKPKTEKQAQAHIQVLEKTIRRDLGARTSYSKYLMSSGLQEGLFGICKAYALYDQEVGYAQGMNFIVMPLLFNVSHFS